MEVILSTQIGSQSPNSLNTHPKGENRLSRIGLVIFPEIGKNEKQHPSRPQSPNSFNTNPKGGKSTRAHLFSDFANIWKCYRNSRPNHQHCQKVCVRALSRVAQPPPAQGVPLAGDPCQGGHGAPRKQKYPPPETNRAD